MRSALSGGFIITVTQKPSTRFWVVSRVQYTHLLLSGRNHHRNPLNFLKRIPICGASFAYLMKQRHIDRDVIAYFAKAKTLFEDSKYHNCVFVGTDEQGIPRHAHKRSANSFGKSFRQNVEGSDPRYSFHHLGTDGKLYVFEAPIDMLSFITLYPEDWKSHNYVACCGTSTIPVMSMLSRMPHAQEVFLCLDNDAAGQAASLRMAEQIAEQFGIASDRLTPQNKDWNDDLCVLEDAQVPFLEMG